MVRTPPRSTRTGTLLPSTTLFRSALLAALADDLNTPLALAELHDIASAMNKAKQEDKREDLAGGLLAGAALLGLLQDDPDAWFKGAAAEGALQPEAIEAMIPARIDKSEERRGGKECVSNCRFRW